jgi:hypothetical protein
MKSKGNCGVLVVWKTEETALIYICKIRGFHGGDYEELRFLGCYAMRLL